MSELLPPFNTAFHYDAQLHEVPDDPEDLAEALRWCVAQVALHAADTRLRVRLLGQAGVFARQLRQLADAEQLLTRALAFSADLNDQRLLTANRLRMAHVYQWQLRFAEADAVFAQEIARCKTVPELQGYLAFAYQHAGKSKFDQGVYEVAAAFFREALALREQQGDPQLIESSRRALQRTLELLQAHEYGV